MPPVTAKGWRDGQRGAEPKRLRLCWFGHTGRQPIRCRKVLRPRHPLVRGAPRSRTNRYRGTVVEMAVSLGDLSSTLWESYGGIPHVLQDEPCDTAYPVTNKSGQGASPYAGQLEEPFSRTGPSTLSIAIGRLPNREQGPHIRGIPYTRRKNSSS